MSAADGRTGSGARFLVTYGAAVAFALALGFGGAAAPALAGDAAAPAPAPAVEAPADASGEIALRAGAVRGRLLQPDGEAPIAGATIVLRDAEGKVVAEGRSGDDGAFDLGALPPGAYELEIGRASGSVAVVSGVEGAEALLLLLGHEVAKPLTAAQDADEQVTFLFWQMSEEAALASYAVIGVASVGAGVGIAAAAGAFDDDDDAIEAEVSPTNP